MAYVVLARKYRPRKFEEVVGQEALATTLRNAIQSSHVAHAYLFAGPRGVGKTSMARILAAALNCEKGPTSDPCGTCQSCRNIFAGEDVDVIEIDGASNTGVENIRELRSNASYAPAHSRFKIYIIDEVHMLSTSAFNALLKTLEEPPGHVKFIFATTEPHKVIETVQSRCQRFDFRNISTADIVKRLEQICRSEGVKAEEPALWMVARRARGGMRDSQSFLDQLMAYDGEKVTVETVEKVLGRSLDEEVFELLEIIDRRDPAGALKLVERLSGSGESVVEFLGQFQEGVRNLMVLTAAGSEDLLRDVPGDQVARLKTFKGKFTLQSVLYMMAVVSEAIRRARTATQRRMLVELALVKLATMEEMSALSEIIARLEALENGSGGAGGAVASVAAPRVAEGSASSAPSSSSERTIEPTGNPTEQAWQEVLERLRQTGKRSIAAFGKEGSVQSWKDGELVIGFSKECRFHRGRLEEVGMRKEVEEIASEVLGQRVRLKLVETGTAKTRSESESEPEIEEPGEASEVRSAKAAGKGGEGPLVRKATELFRGRVVDRE